MHTNKTNSEAHIGWEAYYQTQQGEKAWGGVADAYLMQHLPEILPPPGANVLDLAAGDGRNTVAFFGRGYNIIATDLSPTALSSFQKRCLDAGGEVPIVLVGDFMQMAFVEGQFSAIVCFNSIPHFPSVPKVLAKMCALLAKKGRAAFNAFTRNDVSFGLGEKLAENMYFYKDTLFTFASENEIKAMLPSDVQVLHSETRNWEEPDHGSYRTGTHTHEACFFVIERV